MEDRPAEEAGLGRGTMEAETVTHFNPKNAFEFTDIGLSLENTLPTLLRLRSLASGFETFALRRKAKLSRPLTVFKRQPDIGKCIIWV
jgi:hypothetical protein